MNDAVATSLIILLVVAAGGAVLRRVAKMRTRTRARQTMHRVYYLRGRMRDDVPEYRRLDAK